jgi:hypothetical protein
MLFSFFDRRLNFSAFLNHIRASTKLLHFDDSDARDSQIYPWGNLHLDFREIVSISALAMLIFKDNKILFHR